MKDLWQTDDPVGAFSRKIILWQLEMQDAGVVPELTREVIEKAGVFDIPKTVDRFAKEQYESYMTAYILLRGKLEEEPFPVPESIREYNGRIWEIRKDKALLEEGEIEFFERDNSNLLAYRRFVPGGREKTGELLVVSNLGGRMEHVHTSFDLVSYERLLGNYEPRRDKKEWRPFECVVLRHR
jgi:hypothetical protein